MDRCGRRRSGGVGMKLGVFTVLYRDLPFEEMLDKVVELGLDAVELGTGNYPGDAHCKPDELLADPQKAKAYKEAITSRGLVISGLSQHGNPVHPDPDFRERDRAVWEKTVRLAEVLEVPVVMAFSGCPGDHEGAKYPNWVTCPWPDDYLKILEWQWNDVVIPYWTEAAAFAEQHGVRRSRSRCIRASSCTTRRRCSSSARRSGRRSARTSTRATCSGRASTSSRRSSCSVASKRSSTCTRRTRTSTAGTSPGTACWTRSTTDRSSIVRGRSEPSDTAKASRPGASS